MYHPEGTGCCLWGLQKVLQHCLLAVEFWRGTVTLPGHTTLRWLLDSVVHWYFFCFVFKGSTWGSTVVGSWAYSHSLALRISTRCSMVPRRRTRSRRQWPWPPHRRRAPWPALLPGAPANISSKSPPTKWSFSCCSTTGRGGRMRFGTLFSLEVKICENREGSQPPGQIEKTWKMSWDFFPVKEKLGHLGGGGGQYRGIVRKMKPHDIREPPWCRCSFQVPPRCFPICKCWNFYS